MEEGAWEGEEADDEMMLLGGRIALDSGACGGNGGKGGVERQVRVVCFFNVDYCPGSVLLLLVWFCETKAARRRGSGAKRPCDFHYLPPLPLASPNHPRSRHSHTSPDNAHKPTHQGLLRLLKLSEALLLLPSTAKDLLKASISSCLALPPPYVKLHLNPTTPTTHTGKPACADVHQEGYLAPAAVAALERLLAP